MAWHHQRITLTQTLAAPAALLFVSGCAGGSGGGGGNPTPGGGGGGGCSGQSCYMVAFPCVPGETITATIGSAGLGGAANAAGVDGGHTFLSGSLFSLALLAGIGGAAAVGTSGGNGGKWFGGATVIAAGVGGGNGVAGGHGNMGGLPSQTGNYYLSFAANLARFSSGGGGGGFGASGGYGFSAKESGYNSEPGSGGVNGGGGGGGGCSPWGGNGHGGSNGNAGTNANGYGAGGGGGSGNSAGGAGSPGMLDIFWEDANETVPPTVAAIRTELDSNSTRLASIDGKTTNLPSSPAAVGSAMTLTSAYDAAKTAATQTSVNAIPTTPLLAANYTAPDNAGIAAIQAKTDNLPASPAAVGSAMDLNSTALSSVRDEVSSALGAYDPPTQAEMETAITAVATDIGTIIDRIEEQVAEGPVLVVPAPSAATSTVAWVRCYDRHGAPEPGVVIQIRMDRVAGTGGAYTSEITEYVSDEEGLVTAEIQRGAGLRFSARRGAMGKWINFDGVDDETLSLPSLLGTP